MENNEFYSLGDLPVSTLMDGAPEQDDDKIVEHSGIKGMKWGIRRYQNKDGSLTPAGKKRYNQELAKVREAEKTLKAKQATKTKLDRLEARKKAVEEGEKELESENVPALTRAGAKKAAKAAAEAKAIAEKREKDIERGKIKSKDMTTEELQSRIDRLNLEKSYNDAMKNSQNYTKGSRFVSKFSDSAIDKLADGVAADLLAQSVKAVTVKGLNELSKKFGLSDEDVVFTNNKRKN